MNIVNSLNFSELPDQMAVTTEKAAGTLAGAVMGTIWSAIGTTMITYNSVSSGEDPFENFKEGAELFESINQNDKEMGISLDSAFFDAYGDTQSKVVVQVLKTLGRIGDYI